MRFKNLLLSFILTLTLFSCSQIQNDTNSIYLKTDEKKIKDSIRKSINDSIAKSDSAKAVIGIAKLNNKTKVILYDNYKWEYKSSTEIQNKKAKITQRQVQTLMQNYEPKETQYVTSRVCGALTKKGGRCWQH